ncbi:MAG: hypothetical protein NTZ83_04680 [Candidatus Pacearchaeota archaeon]|nr:hypothetical protein [Candidatus Pacearchaeota archaeon]
MKESMQKLKKENARLRMENEVLKELLNSEVHGRVPEKRPKRERRKYTREID